MFIIGLRYLLVNIKNKKTIPLMVLVLIATLACLLAKNKFEAFFGSENRLEGLITYIGYIGFFLAGTNLKYNEKTKKIANSFLITATLIAVITLLRTDLTYKMLNIPRDIHYYFYQGTFCHFNHFGYYLLIANTCATFMFIYANNIKEKLLYFIISAILLYTLVINDTFGVYLAYILVLLITLIINIIKKTKRKEIFIATMMFIIISAITYRYDYNIHIVSRNFSELLNDTQKITNTENIEDIYSVGTSRGKLWISAVKYISKKPLTGYGFDNIKYEYRNDNIDETRTHNLILEQATNIGIIGMIIYMYIILSIIIKKIIIFNKIDNLTFLALLTTIGYLASSMFGNSTFYISPYFYIFLGILAQEVKNENIKTKQK